MATKIKKKCVRSKAIAKKGQGIGIHAVIVITLMIVALVATMTVLSANRDALAEITDSVMEILAKLGLVHLSDNDRIALASMQAVSCAVDVVAFYSNNPLPGDDVDIFANIDSCNADIIDAGSEPSTIELVQLPIIVGSCGNSNMDSGEECDDGNTEDGDGCSSSCVLEELPVLTGVQTWTNVDGVGIPKTLIGSYECSGNTYKIELVDIIYAGTDYGQALKITRGTSVMENYLDIWKGDPSETVGDIELTTTSAIVVIGSPSDSKVSGEVGCNS